MNKYKNKTLYRLIPIKEAVFFSVKSSKLFFLFAFCFFNIKEYKFCHLSVDSVIVFYIYTIIYSLKFSFKPEWISFFFWT